MVWVHEACVTAEVLKNGSFLHNWSASFLVCIYCRLIEAFTVLSHLNFAAPCWKVDLLGAKMSVHLA